MLLINVYVSTSALNPAHLLGWCGFTTVRPGSGQGPSRPVKLTATAAPPATSAVPAATGIRSNGRSRDCTTARGDEHLSRAAAHQLTRARQQVWRRGAALPSWPSAQLVTPPPSHTHRRHTGVDTCGEAQISAAMRRSPPNSTEPHRARSEHCSAAQVHRSDWTGFT